MAWAPHPRNFAPRPKMTPVPKASALNPSTAEQADTQEAEVEKPAQFLVHQASASGGGGYGFSGSQSPLAQSLLNRTGPSVTAQLATKIKSSKRGM